MEVAASVVAAVARVILRHEKPSFLSERAGGAAGTRKRAVHNRHIFAGVLSSRDLVGADARGRRGITSPRQVLKDIMVTDVEGRP